MTEVRLLLARVRFRVLRQNAVVWASNGAVVAAVGALVFELTSRRWPVDPAWPVLVLCVAAGGAIAPTGWLRGWPSGTRIAQPPGPPPRGQEAPGAPPPVPA